MVQDIGFQARHKSCVILRNNWNKKKHRVSTSQKLNKNNSFKRRNSFQTRKHNITSLRNKRLFLFSPLLSRLASTHLCNSSQLVFALPQKTKEAGGKKKRKKIVKTTLSLETLAGQQLTRRSPVVPPRIELLVHQVEIISKTRSKLVRSRKSEGTKIVAVRAHTPPSRAHPPRHEETRRR